MPREQIDPRYQVPRLSIVDEVGGFDEALAGPESASTSSMSITIPLAMACPGSAPNALGLPTHLAPDRKARPPE